MAAAFNGNERLVKHLLAGGRRSQGHRPERQGGHRLRCRARLHGCGEDAARGGRRRERIYGNDFTALMWAAGYSDEAPSAEGMETVKSLVDAGAGSSGRQSRAPAVRHRCRPGHAAKWSLYLLSSGADNVDQRQGRENGARSGGRRGGSGSALSLIPKTGHNGLPTAVVWDWSIRVPRRARRQVDLQAGEIVGHGF